MNKKKLFIIVIAGVFAVAAATILGFIFIERPAFPDIEKEEISSVSYFIYYYENEEPVYLPLPKENVDELLELMHNIRIKGFNNPDVRYYTGVIGFMFKIQMNDGKVIEFSAENPYILINGRYYESEYKQTNALYEFWRGFVDKGRKEYGLSD